MKAGDVGEPMLALLCGLLVPLRLLVDDLLEHPHMEPKLRAQIKRALETYDQRWQALKDELWKVWLRADRKQLERFVIELRDRRASLDRYLIDLCDDRLDILDDAERGDTGPTGPLTLF